MRPWSLLILVLVLVLILGSPSASRAGNPLDNSLNSWNPGPTRSAILDFVQVVCDPDGPAFVPPAERIAVFDNDGTSLCERPGHIAADFQVSMLRHRVTAGTVDGSALSYRAWLAGDADALKAYGWSQAYGELDRLFVGMPVVAYADSAVVFLERSRHPRFDRPFTDLYYAPMLELKAYLEDHGFQVWLVTGSEQAFVRAFAEQAAGFPPEHVIGSWTTPVYRRENGKGVLVRGTAEVRNGHEHKPENIGVRIGRRPIFAAGNSDNDEPMCRYALTGERAGLAIWIHHDDAAREYAYGRPGSRIELLCVDDPHAFEVSMARDWNKIFVR